MAKIEVKRACFVWRDYILPLKMKGIVVGFEMRGWCCDCLVVYVFFTDGGSGIKSPLKMKGFAYDLEMVGEMGGWCCDCCVFYVLFTDGGVGWMRCFKSYGGLW